jgi:hypothetical protein
MYELEWLYVYLFIYLFIICHVINVFLYICNLCTLTTHATSDNKKMRNCISVTPNYLTAFSRSPNFGCQESTVCRFY